MSAPRILAVSSWVVVLFGCGIVALGANVLRELGTAHERAAALEHRLGDAEGVAVECRLDRTQLEAAKAKIEQANVEAYASLRQLADDTHEMKKLCGEAW